MSVSLPLGLQNTDTLLGWALHGHGSWEPSPPPPLPATQKPRAIQAAADGQSQGHCVDRRLL
jgi:hypothetical protein